MRQSCIFLRAPGAGDVGRDEARWWVDEQIRRWIAEGLASRGEGPLAGSWWHLREGLAEWLRFHDAKFGSERITVMRHHRRDAAE